jgi:predicted chitinase
VNLPHDAQGFLIGEVIPEIRRATELLQRIRSDVADIKRAFLSPGARAGSGPSIPPLANRQSPGRAEPRTAEPRPRSGSVSPHRDAHGRFIASGADTALPGTRQRPSGPWPEDGRDSRGRFTSNSDPNREKQAQQRAFHGMADRLANAVTGSAAGLEAVDPSIKAFNEVAQPLARGYRFFAGGDKDERWYKKLFKELNLFRKEQTVFNRAEQRVLREIDENTENAGGSSGGARSGGFFGGLLGGIAGRVLPLLMTGLSFIFGPVGLALAGAATAAWGLFTEDGRKFFANAADSFKVGWEATTGYLKGKWDAGVQAFNDLWAPIGKFFADKFGIVSESAQAVVDKVADTANQANAFVKDQTGVDVKESVTAAGKAIQEKAAYGLDVASELASKAKAKFTGRASDNKAALVKQMSASGISDPKEQALFLAQMDHESGGFSRLEENLNYRSPKRLMEISKTARLKGANAVKSALSQGPEGVAELLYGGRKDLGNSQAGDGYKFRGRGFTQLTGRANYAEAGKALGLDLENNPDLAASPAVAAQIAVWFHQKNAPLVKASRAGDVRAARQRVNGGENGLAEVRAKYRDYLAETTAGKYAVASLKPVMPIQMAQVQSVSAPSPSVPAMPKPPVIAEAPKVMMPLTGESRKSISINIDRDDIGQDISDRRLAHIVTGGLSG